MTALLEMKAISKVYPNGVTANRAVDFHVETGEIHALVGENGAGKSTLNPNEDPLWDGAAHRWGNLSARPTSFDYQPAARHRVGHRHGPPKLHAGPLIHSGAKYRARP